MHQVKLLTFDLVNTLVKVRVAPAQQYAAIARSLGIDVREADINKVYQATWRQKKLDHPAYGAFHGLSHQQWWSDFISRVFTAAGFRGDPALLSKVSEALVAHYNHGKNVWEMLPGISKNLEDLKRAGFRLGVVSNSDESTVPTLRSLGLAEFFDFVVNTANTRLEKPNPEIFRKALEAGNVVDPAEAAHVGDEIDSDYRAPRKIGMISFLVDRQRRFRNEDLTGVDPRCIIRDLAELRNLLTVKQ